MQYCLCQPRTVKNKRANGDSTDTAGCEGKYYFAEHGGKAPERLDIAEISEYKEGMRETVGISNPQEIGYVAKIQEKDDIKKYLRPVDFPRSHVNLLLPDPNDSSPSLYDQLKMLTSYEREEDGSRICYAIEGIYSPFCLR